MIKKFLFSTIVIISLMFGSIEADARFRRVGGFFSHSNSRESSRPSSIRTVKYKIKSTVKSTKTSSGKLTSTKNPSSPSILPHTMLWYMIGRSSSEQQSIAKSINDCSCDTIKKFKDAYTECSKSCIK